MKTISILIILISSLAVNAQNHGAQYLSSGKKNGSDSVKSEFNSTPSNSGYTETVISKKPTSESKEKENATQNNADNVAANGSEATTNDAMLDGNNGTGNSQTELSSQNESTTQTDCPERIGPYAILAGIIAFILGLILGFVIKGRMKDKQQ